MRIVSGAWTPACLPAPPPAGTVNTVKSVSQHTFEVCASIAPCTRIRNMVGDPYSFDTDRDPDPSF
jgi:hypothetical protein